MKVYIERNGEIKIVRDGTGNLIEVIRLDADGNIIMQGAE